MQGNKYRLLPATVLVSVILISAWLISKEARQNHLDRTLVAAVKSGDVTAVRTVLADGADPNSRDFREISVVQIILRWFARLRNAKSVGDDTTPSALFLAVSAGPNNQAVIDALLKHGADPNAQIEVYKYKSHVRTLILYAALEGELDTIHALAIAGADVNVRDENGVTTLSFICSYADAETVRTLLDKGANPNIRDNRGGTSLLAAVDGWNAKVVRLLIERGADKNIATKWSMTEQVLKQRMDKLVKLTGRSIDPDAFERKAQEFLQKESDGKAP